MPNLSAFLSYAVITTYTPGPNNIMAMSNASKYGFKRAIPFNAGVFLGSFVIFILSNLFSAALLSIIPSIKPIMVYIGAGYILWLAWKIYHSKPNNVDENNIRTNTVSTGVMLQFINLKVIIYGITMASTFITPYYKSKPILVAFSVLLAFNGFVSTCCWSIGGSILQRFFQNHGKIINIVMALLLVYTAISILL